MSALFKLSSLSLLAILLLSMCLLCANTSTAQTDQVSSKLQAANEAVSQTFNAILDAEKTGANVTDILFQFNYVIEVLAKAETSYRVGNLNQAAIQSDSVLPIAHKVIVSAHIAKQTALVSSKNALWSTIILTVVSVIIFLLVLFLIWLLFKRQIVNNLSQAKPEVNYQ
jgi:hypothetical protein